MTGENEFNQVLLEILRQEVSPEAVRAKNMLLRRMATENQIAPSRIPQPMNITEIGGYLNLLEKLGHTDLQYGTLASILGQPHKGSESEFYDVAPVTFFSQFTTDRPDCKGVAEIPLTFAMRNDFAASFASVMSSLKKAKASLPLMSPLPQLPALGTIPSEGMALYLIGRIIEIAPSTVRVDPKTDPIVVTGDGLYVRGDFDKIKLKALKNDGSTVNVDGRFALLNTLMAQAGWYQSEKLPTVFINVTGLTQGRTTYGDELSRLYTGAQITASGVRELIPRIWNGNGFTLGTEGGSQ